MDSSALLFLFALIASGVQVYYYGWIFRPIEQADNPLPSPTLPPLSVIICAREEEKSLRLYLPLVLSQDYPQYEVIVIEDNSSDGSKEVLDNLVLQYPHLRYTSIGSKELPGKKGALLYALKMASFSHLVFTDADCYPASDKWLTAYGEKFAGGADIVLGFGAYTDIGTLLSQVVQYETLLTSMQYHSWWRAGLPYMAVGRNWGYHSKLNPQGELFYHLPPISGGDDDLLLQKIVRGANTQVIFNQDAITWSAPPKGWREWIAQKRRHTTAGRYYMHKYRLRLAIFFASHAGWIGLSLMGLSSGYGSILLIIIILRWVVMIRRVIFWKNLHHSKLILNFTVIMDVLFPFYLIAIGLASMITPKKNW